jgi:hypothetical protein
VPNEVGTSTDDMPPDRPRCAICKKPIERGEGRIRRGLASMHMECAKRAKSDNGKIDKRKS